MKNLNFYSLDVSNNQILRMMVNESGNVGIGTSTANSRLEVAGDISFNGNIYQNGSLLSSGGGGGGSSNFLGLTDTPSTFTASKFLAVNSGGTAVEFVDAPSGGGGSGTTIDETTDVSLNNLKIHGDLSANDASFNVIETTSLRINGVDIIDGAPEALDTLSELAAALDNSANFATNVLTTLSNKQDTLTAGSNITITGNTISSSGGGGLTDLSATSINDLSDVSLNGIQLNQTLKWDGENFVPTTLATTDTKQGQVLETLAGLCDGRTVTVESGSYTLDDSKLTSAQGGDNTLGSQVLNETWQTVRGSEISYLPPSGTKQVIFKFHLAIKWNDPTFITLFKLSIDSTDNVFFKCIRHDGYSDDENTLVFVIDIGTQNSISNGQFLTWNTSKTLKLQARNQASSNNSILFQTETDSNAGAGGEFIYPTLEIVAIGETSGQAVTLTNNSVNDLSDISFNSSTTTDGQALVWNSTDSVWEAGAVASSGTTIDETTDVSMNNVKIHGDLSANDASFNVIDASSVNTTSTSYMHSIIPSANNTYSLGDPSNVWKDVYIGPGSLYIDGQKVLESDANTIVVGADENQNLKLNTTGSGVLQLESASGIQITSTGSGNIELGSTGTGIVRITDNLALNGNIEIYNDSTNTVTINDSLDVTGNYLQNGTNINTIYATLASPTLTGTPLAPTATSGTNTTQIATTAFVATAVSNLVNSAPATLDTLSELAAALDNSANFATNVTTTLGDLQTQINTNASSVQNTINEDLVVVGTQEFTVTVAGKSSNNTYYNTGSISSYFINGKEAPFLKFTPGKTYRFLMNDSTNSTHPLKFYLEADKTTEYSTNVTTSGTAGQSNAYVEIEITDTTPTKLYYQCGNHGYMGSVIIIDGYSNISDGDLTIAKTSGLQTALDAKQATLTAGTNITITGNTISASGGGDGLTDLSASSISDLSDVSLNGIQLDQSLKWDGEKLVPYTPGTTATSITKQGQVLETLTGVCDGRTVVVESGSYTLPNVTAYQDTTTSWTDVSGSNISYKPPPGTKQVIYELYIQITSDTEAGTSSNNRRGDFQFELLVDNNPIEINDHQFSDEYWYQLSFLFRGIIDIGVDDLSNGKISSWDTNKEIKLQVMSSKLNTYLSRINCRKYDYEQDTTGATAYYNVSQPTMKITAIGESTGQAVTLTNNSVNDLSDISFNSTSTTDGQALVWNSTDGVWEAGAVASSGGGLTDLSASSISDLSDVSFNAITATDGATLAWNTSEQLWKPSNVTNSIGANIVNVSSGTTVTYTAPKSSPGVEIQSLRVSITPTAMDSVIELNWKVFCDGYRNIGFRVTRNINGSDVLVYDDGKNHNGSFLAMVTFDETGTTSTQTSPQVVPISWFDEPNTTSEVTYKLWVGNSWNSTETITINKNHNSTDGDGREYGVSTVAAIEHPKTKTLVPATSITKQGQVLETLTGVCDGRTVVVESGSYTLPNVTTSTTISTTTYDLIPGSSIDYTPPIGSTAIIYEFTFTYGREVTNNTSQWTGFEIKLYLDDIEVTNANTTMFGDNIVRRDSYKWTFKTDGSSSDTANGIVTSWNSSKNIKLKAKARTSCAVHRSEWSITGADNTDEFVIPTVQITAIGESSGQAVTLTNNSVNDLSDISFNSTSTTDGQALVWNSTDGVWEAGAVASSGGGLTDLSASSINDLSDVSFNATTATDGATLAWDTIEQLWKPSNVTNTIGVNMEYNTVTTVHSYLTIAKLVTVANTVSSSTEITQMEISITPKYDDSVINLQYMLNYEGYSNTVFRIVRNVGSTNTVLSPDGGDESGIATVPFDTANSTTPQTSSIQIYDEPNTTSQVTYKLYIHLNQETNTGYDDFVLNGSLDQSYSYAEKMISTVAAIEYPKTKTLVPATSITKQGQVLETLAGVCDGRTVVVESGSYTLPNVTTVQGLTTTYAEITGSKITYTPPPNTKQVIYIFKSKISVQSGGGSHSLGHYKLYIDGVEQTGFRYTYGATYIEGNFTLNWTIDIGSVSSTDNVNSRFANWTSGKTIKLEGREWGSNNQQKLHATTHWEGSGQEVFTCPQLEITAIGESSGQAVTLTNNSVSDLSDISFNSTSTTDGQALVWNSTDSVWEAGTVASSGGLTDLSATSISDLSDVSFNTTTATDGATLAWNTSEQLWKPSNVTNTIGVNMVTTYFSTYQTVTIPSALPGYHVSELDLTIKPMYNDSIIEIKFNVYGDFDENACFRIKRNNDFVVPTTDKNTNALVTAIYDNNDANTPTINLVRWYDTPNTTDSITYKLYINRAHTSSITSYINGTASNVNDWEEQGISTASAIEHPKPKTLVPATSITKQGQVLETLAGVCDGRTVVVESGSYTLPNVTTTFEMTDGLSYVDLPNSSFSYKPPTGTSQVIYRFKINITSLDAHGIANFKLYIDNTEVTNFVRSWTGKGPDEDTLILDYTFEIGQANDITNGKFLTWNTTKNIKIKVREYSSSGHEVKFYSRGYWEGSYQYGTDGFVCPSLEIIAIGESSGQAVTLTNNSVSDLSDISFNSTSTTDGQALVWNSTDSVWEAGTVASSGSSWTTSSSDIYYDSGNVGIGTTSPGAKLVVKNSTNSLSGTLTSESDYALVAYGDKNNAVLAVSHPNRSQYITLSHNGIYKRGSTSAYFEVMNTNSNELRLGTNNTTKMTILSGGNVGIGTTSPSTLLVVGEDGGGHATNTQGIHMKSTTSNTKHYVVGQDTTHNVFLSYYANSTVANGYGAVSCYGGNNNLCLQHGGGNVGIGTTNPGEKLSVNGSIQIKGSSNSTVTNESKLIFTRDLADSDESEYIAKIYTANYTGPLILESTRGNGYVKAKGNSTTTAPLFTVNDYNDSEKFRVCGNGNVGIGTTSPERTLHLYGNRTDIVFERSGEEKHYIRKDGDYLRFRGHDDATVLFEIKNNTNGNNVCSFPNGNVGIGMTNPSYKLHVNGTVAGTSAFVNTSDDRIKHNEQVITNALSTISKITPKHYFKTGTKMYDASHNFIMDSSGNPLDSSGNPLTFKEDYTIETGIIAQEIRTIPELHFAVYGEEYTEETITTYKKDISGNDVLDESGNKIVESIETQQKPNTLAVDYNSIHCTHIVATKELHQLVQSQQTEMEQQQNEIEHLKLVNQDMNNQLNTLTQENQQLQNDIMLIKQQLNIQ